MCFPLEYFFLIYSNLHYAYYSYKDTLLNYLIHLFIVEDIFKKKSSHTLLDTLNTLFFIIAAAFWSQDLHWALNILPSEDM